MQHTTTTSEFLIALLTLALPAVLLVFFLIVGRRRSGPRGDDSRGGVTLTAIHTSPTILCLRALR